jgi:predicted GNAT family acetyltransferase
MSETVLTDDAERSRFELRVDGDLVGWVDYRPAGASVIVAHTQVLEGREGEGLGGTLVREALDLIAAGGKTVIPTCPFATAWLHRHPEYADRVDPSFRGQFR